MAAAPRGKGRPTLTEAAEIDRVIRKAALHVLLEQGEAATMNAVAVVAGLSRKTVYARYPNKSELFLTVIRELMENATEIAYDRSGDAEDRLYSFICAALRIVSEPDAQAIQRLLSLNPTYIAALKPEMQHAVGTLFLMPLRELLREAAERGEFVIDELDATARIIMVVILAERLAPDRAGGGRLGSGEASTARLLTRLLTRGLRPDDRAD